MLSATLANMEELSKSSSISNFVNGSVWKDIKTKFGNKTVIPFNLYFDDFEPDNPLGSHTGEQSIGAFYIGFPTMPQFLTSLLENIFPVMLIKTNYIKNFSNDKSLQQLVHVFMQLEDEGIVINNRKIYFVLGAVVGDNLATNSLLGFAQSFTAHYFCRICKQIIGDIEKSFEEDVKLLRNFANYNEDLKLNIFKKTGIHEDCIFNCLKSFHVTLNVAVDIMHDLFEEVLKNDLSLIILYFINKKYFTLEQVNSRKQLFDYGPIEVGNISLPLTLEQLKSRKIKMSATESWTFLHFLPLMVGDLVSHDCPVWKFLLNLQTLVDTCLLSRFKESDLELLNKLVKYHNKVYVQLFGEHLKPKAHFLIHYVTVVKRLGPLKFMWCLRYEAKHKELKAYCKANYSRRDICYSLTVKVAMKLANRFFS